jgi:hypothetical protein
MLVSQIFSRGKSLAATLAVAGLIAAQPLTAQQPTETSRTVSGGGVFAPGWTGKIDANEEKAGQTLNGAKFSMEGKTIKVTTGPAVSYWNPANKASGDYTVKATFTEPKYMNLKVTRIRTASSLAATIWEPRRPATCIARHTATATSSCAASVRMPFR